MTVTLAAFVLGLVAVSAFPADQVFGKFDANGLRYSYLEDDSGKAHLVDNWLKFSDLARMARYDPDRSNAYHLFTRNNPSVSQPLVLNDVNRLTASNFRASRRTVMLMHGFAGSATSGFNTVLVPAFLVAQDVNVIVLDWSAGSIWGPNAAQAGQAAGRFIDWLNSVTGATPEQYHIAGYSVGGQGAGIIGRSVTGNVGYVTGLDPAERWDTDTMFRPNDGIYTEVIHTSTMGELSPLAQVDFYPNGGTYQAGCMTELCSHYRSYHFFAESLTNGGFTATRCTSLQQATSQTCNGSGTLRMGGITPKTGSSGIFGLTTNAWAPFSRG